MTRGSQDYEAANEHADDYDEEQGSATAETADNSLCYAVRQGNENRTFELLQLEGCKMTKVRF